MTKKRELKETRHFGGQSKRERKGEKQMAWETRGAVMVEKRRGPRAFLCDYTHVRRPDILSAVSEGLLTPALMVKHNFICS